MIPAPIPPFAKAVNPKHIEIPVGPPQGVSDDDCGTINALVGVRNDSTAFSGSREFRVYWKPQEHDLKALNDDGVVEIVFLTPQLVAHSVSAMLATDWEEDAKN